MQRLNHIDSIQSDIRLSDLYIPFSELLNAELRELVELGFRVTIEGNRVYLEGIEAWCRLIGKELIYFPGQEAVQDFMEYNDIGFWSGWEVDWFKSYISEDRRLVDILDDIQTDWVLDEDEKAKLYLKRNSEYNLAI